MARSIRSVLSCIVVTLLLSNALFVGAGECQTSDTADAATGRIDRSTGGDLLRRLGVGDNVASDSGYDEDYLAKAPLEHVYLRPKQTSFDNPVFNEFLDCSNYPVVEIHFYAGPGYINIDVDPMNGYYDVAFYLRTEGPYPQGELVLGVDDGGLGQYEYGSYGASGADRYVLIVGFSHIESCGDLINWAQNVNVRLDFPVYKWDLRVDSVWASSPYPDENGHNTVTVAIKNYGSDSLIAGYPWNYRWDIGFNYSPNRCDTKPPNSRFTVTSNLAPGRTGLRDFDVYAPTFHGIMNAYVKADAYDSLVIKNPVYQCNGRNPLQLLWQTDITGRFTVFDSTSMSYQSLPNFRFEVIKADTYDTTVVDTTETDAAGYYSATVPAGDYEIKYRLSTGQLNLHTIWNAMGVPHRLQGVYSTGSEPTSESLHINLPADSTTSFSNTSLYTGLSIMRDIYTTDSITRPYLSARNIDISYSPDILLDTTGASDNVFTLINGRPAILLGQGKTKFQIACHEYGHFLMYKLQGDSTRPPAPSDTLTQHHRDDVTDTVFAFDEGFAEFIHRTSSVPEAAITSDGNIERNSWWQGRDNDATTIFSADSVEGCIASILFDLYDNENVPSSRISTEDDNVRSPSYMLNNAFDCIYNYRASAVQTRSLKTFATRLVRDTTASWYYDGLFQPLRPSICAVFADNAFDVPTDFCEVSAIVDDSSEMNPTPLPMSFEVEQNYPNPFNSGTRIQFVAPVVGVYRLEIFGMLGQTVLRKDLIAAATGEQSVLLDEKVTKNWASGVYIYRISFAQGAQTRKMIYLK